MEAIPASSKRFKAAPAAALPDEIVEDILSRLPAKSLRRFQCVSRPWRGLITSSPFRSLHSSKAGRRDRRLFVSPAGHCKSFYACRLQQPAGSSVEEILSCSLFTQGNVFPVSKSCHGLVLLRCAEYDTHYVWNPSTGEILTLPDRTPFRAAGRRPRTFVSYGMGYCSTTNEYKRARWLSMRVFLLPAQSDARHPYRIWLLRDYAADGCWEELRCIDWGAMTDVELAAVKSQRIAPLAMYPDGNTKKVMFGTGSCKAFLVDPSNGIPVVTFSLDGVEHDSQFATMGLFEESLVSVGRASDEIILSSPSAEAWCEVLSRLPTSTVGRLNQVCREWRAITQIECFVDLHLRRQANLMSTKIPQVMFTDGKPNSFKSLESFISGMSDAPPLVDSSLRVVCSKPCHGLNAGSFMCYDFVCNPITGYYKALPLDDHRELRGSSSVFSDIITRRSSLDRSGDGDAMFAGRFGLGYDTEMGTHVLVRVAYKERNLATRDYELECEIRCIEDMFWEELDPPQRPIADTPPAYINGKLYWMADAELGHHRPSSDHEEIIALDVSALKFELLKGPMRIHQDSDASIVELQEQVCMARSHPRKGTLEIWAMKDNGWWSMEYYIEVGRFSPEYSDTVVTPLAVDSEDGRILLSTGKALGYYDPKTAKMQTIYSLGEHTKNKKFVPILVQESLIHPCDQVL
ncbi:hypothetical protein C2845_PM10G02960 [Panicum miliaceum]|uniref:F-box domain-containing protein n=1 Tax=Panicum miliaceum TaxID=4540 RepID=A0A3L6PDI2_PANMI|nr:hypothetical protein C2845_PM10G02960 [Panicum miliaceum]